MPELPEVETVVRDLRPLVIGRTILSVRPGAKKLRKPWHANWNPLVAGTRVEGIRRRGKWMVIDLAGAEPDPSLLIPEPGGVGRRSPSPLKGEGLGVKGTAPTTQSPSHHPRPLSIKRRGEKDGVPRSGIGGGVSSAPRLIVHLGMTGQFTAVDATAPAPDHLHIVFALDAGRELRFRDPRRFGSVTFHPDEPAVGAFFEAVGLGPEPFGLDPAYFREAVRSTSRTLKAVLLDQGIVAGVGNIYADEACFLAGLNPQRRGTSLAPADADRLREAVEVVLTKAIDARGSTIRDYVGGSGLRGGFQAEHRVYGRTGDPCSVCGTVIACVRLSGRSSHFCRVCQPVHHKGTKAAQRVTKKTQNDRR